MPRTRSFPRDRSILCLAAFGCLTLLEAHAHAATHGERAALGSAHRVGEGFGPVADPPLEPALLGPYLARTGAGEAPRLDPSAPLWQPGVLDPAAGHIGRWQRELERRQHLLADYAGKDHRAALALLGLLPAVAGDVEREVLVNLVEGVRDDAKRHPLVRSLAADLRGQLHEDAGEFDEARAVYAGQGRMLSWQIVGPFDNANRGGHDRAYGPQLEPYSPANQFEGKLAGEALEWRAYEPGSALGGGYVSFDEFLRPNEYVVAYATTWVHVKSRTKAVLHLGTGGAHEVWVNAASVGEGEDYRRPNPLQEAYALTLDPGWNRILIKVGCEAGAWGFFARISDERGAPIAALEVDGSPPVEVEALPVAAPALAGAGDARARPPVSLRGLFERAADQDDARRPRPEAELELTEFYSWTAPFSSEDFSARDQAREADEAVASVRSALFLARAEDDPARARQANEAGIARAEAVGAAARAEHAQMLIDLAYANASLGLERRAKAQLEQARAVAPDDALIELAHLDQLSGDGFELAALAWLDDLRARYPGSATILREHAGRQLGLGRVRAGLTSLEQYSAAHGGDVGVIEQRMDAHLRLGEVDRAVALAREIVETAPGRPISWQRLAEIEEAGGDYQAAVAALETALDLAPADPQLHTALGLLYSRAGDQPGSVIAFQRSLELNPQQPELRDLLATLGAEADDVFTRHAVELEAVVAAAAGEPTPASWAGKEAATLHHMVATRIGANGLGERLDHRIIKILDERGIDSQSRHDFGYEPDQSYVEVRRARVMRADGRVEDIGVSAHYMVGSSGYRMYYDQRAVAVSFPSLRVGDVVEIAFVKRDVATRNMFDDYFGDIVPLQSVGPIRHFEYLLEAPADMSLYFNHEVERSTEQTQAGTGEGPGTRQYRLVRDQLPGLRTEGGMPGWTDVAEYLHVSSYATWDEVGRWYWGLVEGQLLVDDAIRAGVAEAIAPLPADASERDKVAAIYRHVIEQTRYVGLEFGIHGYKPYRTTDIYNRRFGDCKDKASLVKVMLGELGIDSHLVLVRTRDLGTLAERPASLSAFNHAIVYVPSLDLFMDGTAEYSGAFELPSMDQGASVAIIRDGKGATFQTIPYMTPDQNHSAYRQRVRLDARGRGAVEHAMDMVGTGAATWRASLEAEDQRLEVLTKMLSRTFPGVEVDRASYRGLDDINVPVRVEAKLSVPGWAQVQDGPNGPGLRWRVLGHEVELLRSMAPQPGRDHALVLGVPNRERRTLHYELPRGLSLEVVPRSQTVESSFGRFELTVTADANQTGATVEMTLEFSTAQIEAAQYPDFREFLREIDGALAQAFEARPAR